MFTLDKRELTRTMINLITVKLLLTFPREMVVSAGSAAWLQSIFVTIVVLSFYVLTYKIYNTNQNIITISRRIGGKGLQIVTGILLSGLLLVNMALTMRAFPESVRIVLLQNASRDFIMVLLIAAVIVGAYNGLEALVRIESLFLPIMGVIMVFFLILMLPFAHLTNLFPILGNGAEEIFGNGFRFVSAFADILVLNYLMPLCPDKETAYKSGLKAILISGGIMTVVNLGYCLVYPYPVSEEFIMPVYQLTRMIRIGDFLAQFDAFFEFIWIIAMLLYTAVYISVICRIWQDTFELKYDKPLIMSVSICAAVIAFVPSSIVSLISTYMKFLNIFYPIAFLLPFVMGIAYWIKQRRELP